MALVKVYLVDDHDLVLQGIKSTIAAEPDMEICGFSHRADQALEDILRLAPQVVVLDMAMPVNGGLWLLAQFREANIEAHALMLSGKASSLQLNQALALGAEGLVSKAELADVLCQAIRALTKGMQFISPACRPLVNLSELPLTEPLTPRERQTLALIAAGCSNKQIGAELGISDKTAKKHRENLMRKLDVHSALEAAYKAYELGVAPTLM